MASSKKGKSAKRAKPKPAGRGPAKAVARRVPTKKTVAKKSASTAPRPKAKVPAVAASGPSQRPAAPLPPPSTTLSSARRHVLSLSFVRDGEEFLARLETNGGQISEFKNRALDQLLTLVASELEDLLE